MTNPSLAPPDPKTAVVRMDGINKWYGAYHALRDIDLQVAPYHLLMASILTTGAVGSVGAEDVVVMAGSGIQRLASSRRL